MMDYSSSRELALSVGVSPDAIIKESWQVALISELYKTTLGENLVFKGGTALRLVYNSFRFSEDLDFSILGNLSYKIFETNMIKIVRRYPRLEISDLFNKRNTYFAHILIKSEEKKIRLGIKLEVSKRKETLRKDKDYILKLVNSPTSSQTPLVTVYTLSRILLDKEDAVKNREQPRDLFDLWFIHEKLGKTFKIQDQQKYSRKEIQDNLNRLIPHDKRIVLDLFIKNKAK